MNDITSKEIVRLLDVIALNVQQHRQETAAHRPRNDSTPPGNDLAP